MIDHQADPCAIVMATLASFALQDRYLDEQQDLQPNLRDALVKALRDRCGDGLTVQISVNEGRPSNDKKPQVKLFGTSFWPDVVVSRGGAPVLGIEVKNIRKGERPSKPIAETVGQCLIYKLLYPRVIGFILRDGPEPKPLEDDARLREMLGKFGIDLVMRYR